MGSMPLSYGICLAGELRLGPNSLPTTSKPIERIAAQTRNKPKGSRTDAINIDLKISYMTL